MAFLTRLLSILFLPSFCAAQTERPNVLLVTADDLGLQLSCYGETHIQTPRIDELASSGVRFEVAYVTHASCSSSRSSMFSGMYPHTTGQIGLANAGFVLDESEVGKNLTRYLRDAGYRTGILGKLHVAPESSFPFDFRSGRQDTRDVRAVAENAAEFLNRDTDQPFFLMVNYADPHFWRDPNKNGHIGFPPTWKGIPADPIPPDAVAGWPFQGFDEPVARRRTSNYYNTVKRLDVGVGLLLEELEKSGHADDTLVIFLGDHGPPFNRGKTTCYEAGLRVPFIVRWPGVSKAGVASEAFVSATDIVPTVLDAAGIGFPRDFHGRSLRPTLVKADAPEGWREYLVGEFHYHGNQGFFPRRAIRDQRYKLIHNLLAGQGRPPGRVDADPTGRFAGEEKYRNTAAAEAHFRFVDPPEWEFYDLESDPVEFHNRIDEPGFAEKVEELRGALDSWRHETDDPLLEPGGMELFQEKGEEAKRRMRR